jgi:hypothetical protein
MLNGMKKLPHNLKKKPSEKIEGAIKNVQYRDTGNTLHSRHRTKTHNKYIKK